MSIPAADVQQKFATLGERVQLFRIGAISSDAVSPLEYKVLESLRSIRLTNSALIILKAKDHERLMPKSQSCPSFEMIALDLNLAIDTTILQERALKTAITSAILYESVNINLSTNASSKDVQALSPYLKQYELVTALQKVMKQMQTSLAEVANKKTKLVIELNKFKNILASQSEELNKTGEETNENQVLKTAIHNKLEKLNVTRMLIATILGISQVNFMENPQWAKVIVSTRKRITYSNLQYL